MFDPGLYVVKKNIYIYIGIGNFYKPGTKSHSQQKSVKVLTSYLTQRRESFSRSLLFFLIGVSVFLGIEAKSRL